MIRSPKKGDLDTRRFQNPANLLFNANAVSARRRGEGTNNQGTSME
jgi:hypothetical protein